MPTYLPQLIPHLTPKFIEYMRDRARSTAYVTGIERRPRVLRGRRVCVWELWALVS